MSEEEEVWVTIVRAPALLNNMDNSTTAIQETSTLLSTLAKQRAEYISNTSSKLRKRGKQFEKAVADCGELSTLGKALNQVRHSVDQDIESLEKEAKSIESIVVDGLVKLTEIKLKQKSEFDSELDKRKKINENMKAQLNKKKKEALKEYNDLQDEMKKILENRELMGREADPKKKDAYKKKVDKYEAIVFKHKSVVKQRFKEVESLVAQTNTHMHEYHFQWLPQYVLKCAQAELEKCTATKDLLSNYVEEQKKFIATLNSSLAQVEAIVTAMDPDADSQLFMQSAIPTGFEAPPPLIQNDLPMPSDHVETGANALLKAGLTVRPNVPGSLNSSFNSSDEKFGGSLDKPFSKSTEYILEEDAPGYEDGDYEEKRYRALYDYDNGGDMSYANLTAGDILIVNDQTDPTWWGGYFENDPEFTPVWIPSEYLEQIE